MLVREHYLVEVYGLSLLLQLVEPVLPYLELERRVPDFVHAQRKLTNVIEKKWLTVQ